jgi:hypothetical protein
MYDLIQATLTVAIEFVTIAGLGGIIGHAVWSQHRRFMTDYCPAVAPYTPEALTEVEEVAPAEEHQPADDVWQTEITTSPARYWVRPVAAATPVLMLCPAKEEVKSTKKSRKPNASKAPAKSRTTKKHQAA